MEEEVEEGQQEQNRDDTVDNGEVPSVELFFIDKASSEKVPKEKVMNFYIFHCIISPVI